MRFRLATLATGLFLLSSCGSSGTPLQDAGPGDGSGPVGDAAELQDSGFRVQDSGESLCSMAIDNRPCVTGSFCEWTAECMSGRCDCISGRWQCSESNICGDNCPSPSDTRCGEACSVRASNCLCQCGGGPDFVTCACLAGAWQCPSC